MSKRKNSDTDDLLSQLGVFAIIGLVALWFTNRTKFYVSMVILIIITIIIFFVVIKIKKHRFNKANSWHSGRNLINELRKMHPTEFEEYIADLYNRLGFTTEAVGRSHDGGIDVIASKDGIKHFIQCKKYITSKVGVSEVRDFYGAMAGNLSGGKGIFITTNIYTTEAENFAEDKPIELVDGDRLLKLIKLTKKDNEELVVSDEKKCPLCGGKLIEKHGRYGGFIGCANYPNCRHTENIGVRS